MALNVPEILGNRKLLCYIRITVMIECILTATSSTHFLTKRFDRSFSWALQLSPAARYFSYESEESTGSYLFRFLLEKHVFIRLLPGKSA